jgi:catechol 2,3-dioxygenase-like lactoylglutathione lyase family enzyme
MATIYVSDMDRAVRFYTQALGLKLQYTAVKLAFFGDPDGNDVYLCETPR